MTTNQIVDVAFNKLNSIANSNLPYDGVVRLFEKIGFDVEAKSASREATVSGDLNNGLRLELMIDAIPVGIRDGVVYENVGVYGTVKPLGREVVGTYPFTVEREPTARFYQQRWEARSVCDPVDICQRDINTYRSIVDRVD